MKLNKKGFTLVELLAVIVILAVVMLVGITVLGPVIENSERSGFWSTLSSFQDAVILEMTNDSIPVPDGGSICIDVTTSKTFQNKDKDFVGKIVVTKSSDKYIYTITAKNKKYGVIGKQLTEVSKDSSTGYAEDLTTVTAVTCS